MIKNKDLAIYLKDIEREEGILTPENVVAHAVSPDSPIHDRFDWDETKAAHQWRLQQARGLIREVQVVWEGREIEEFYNVTISQNTKQKRGYVSLKKVLSDSGLHNQVLLEALKELRHWQEKYRTLSELKGIIFEDKVSQIEKSL